jgi:hypothetical protein
LLTAAAWLWFSFALLYFTEAACPLTALGALALSGLLDLMWSTT